MVLIVKKFKSWVFGKEHNTSNDVRCFSHHKSVRQAFNAKEHPYFSKLIYPLQ